MKTVGEVLSTPGLLKLAEDVNEGFVLKIELELPSGVISNVKLPLANTGVFVNMKYIELAVIDMFCGTGILIDCPAIICVVSFEIHPPSINELVKGVDSPLILIGDVLALPIFI